MNESRPPSVDGLITWGPWTAVIATVVALFVGLMLSIPVVMLDGPSESDDLSTWAMVGAQVMTVFGFIAVPFWVASQAGGGLRAAGRRLGLRRFDSSAIGWMVVAGVGYFVFLIAYAMLIMSPEQEDIASGFGALPVQIFLIVVCASFAEEVCFRGMLYGGLRRKLMPPLAAVVAGLLFGGLHATTGITAVPPLIAFGVALALLYEKTGSLWPPILLHAFNNGIALWALQSGG